MPRTYSDHQALAQVREALHKYEKRALSEAEARGAPVRFIAIDLSPVTDIDASAVHFLKARRRLGEFE